MSSRDEILASIRANRPKVERALPAVPLFDENRPLSLLAAFKESLERMGGTFLDPPKSGDRLAPVWEKIVGAKVVCSAVPEIAGNRDIAAVRAPQHVADVDFAIVRAGFGIAETGSVLLSDKELRVNALAYLAQHLIVLLDPADILVNVHHAYRRPEFRNAHYAAFHTGPSATADIEGVLIHGAQGVRSLSVLPLARESSGAAERHVGSGPH
jgi:L-lactate dehydrogenase complex protein LldG